MNCPNCNFELREGTPFCLNCGDSVAQTLTPDTVERPRATDLPTQGVSVNNSAPNQAGQPASPQEAPAVQPPAQFPQNPPATERKSRYALWISLILLVLVLGVAAVAGLFVYLRGSSTRGNSSTANLKQASANPTPEASPSLAGQTPAQEEIPAKAAGLIQNLTGHSKAVTSVAWMHDGKTVASGSQDQTVRLWDAQSGTLLQTVEEPNNEVDSIAFSSDGKLGAVGMDSGGGQSTVLIVDTQAGKIGDTKEKLNVNNLQVVTFSPDGKFLAVGNTSGRVTLWDTATGTQKQTLEGQDIVTYALSFSPDGKTLAGGGYGNTVKLWDVQTGKLRQTLEGHTSEVHGLAF